MAADENGGGGLMLQVRPAASLAAAGLAGGKFGRCRAAAVPLHSPPF